VVNFTTDLHSENCLDRHAEEDPSRVALIWEKDEPNQHVQVTYRYMMGMIFEKGNVRNIVYIGRRQATNLSVLVLISASVCV